MGGDGGIEGPGREAEPGVGPHRDLHRLHVERVQEVAVRRVAGPNDGHAIASIEGGEEGEHERARRTGGDRHGCRVDLEPVPASVVLGDGPAQLRRTQRAGVAEGVATGVELASEDPNVGRGPA